MLINLPEPKGLRINKECVGLGLEKDKQAVL